MKKRNYTHVQTLLPKISSMLAEGKSQREVAVGILPLVNGRTKKDAAPINIMAEDEGKGKISHYLSSQSRVPGGGHV